MVKVRALKIAAYSIAFTVLPVLLVANLAPYSSAAMGFTSGAVLLSARVVAFPGALTGRHRTCPVADAWTHAISAEENLSKRRLRAASHLVRRDGGLIQMQTPSGLFWIPERDSLVLFEMLDEQERDVYGIGGRGVRRGDVVLDGGANVGVYTRHALDRGAALVVAIDPAPTAVECLRRNFRAEIESGRVIVYPKGIWNKETELELSMNPGLASTANSVALNRGAAGPRVRLTTIDALVRELKLQRVDFIKMDIEGAEAPALEGGREAIGRFKPRMAIAVEHRPVDPDNIVSAVRRLWPNTTSELGPCVNVNGSVQPDVLFVF